MFDAFLKNGIFLEDIYVKLFFLPRKHSRLYYIKLELRDLEKFIINSIFIEDLHDGSETVQVNFTVNQQTNMGTVPLTKI